MPSKFKKLLTTLIAIIALSMPALVPATSYAGPIAGCNNLDQQVQNGISNATGDSNTCGGGGTVQSGISAIAKTAVNILSIVVGAAAVIMLIYAGFRYISSGGESGSVSSAKNALIYAIVGLVIVALAQVIVHLVFNTATNIGSNSITGVLTLL